MEMAHRIRALRFWVFVAVAIAVLVPAQAQEGPILHLDTGGHQAPIWKLAFISKKVSRSAGTDKVIRIWEWRAGKMVRTIRGQSGPGADGEGLRLPSL
jgi:hypothetical protein